MTDSHSLSPEDAQSLAVATRDAMYSRDRTAKALGIKVDSVAPGRAVASMVVRSDMVNGHHICHGGLIFTLADTAFAYACNTYDKATVASACHIDFLAPGKEGSTLMAEAVERSLSGRTGVYDVTVRDDAGKTLALFRGKSYRLNGDVIAGLKQGDHA